MITCFIGTDTQKARDAAFRTFEEAKREYPNAAVYRFDDLSFDLALATEQLGSENLFGGKNILYFEGILEHSDGESFYRTTLRETEHIVIVREVAPVKDLMAFLERVAQVRHVDLPKAPPVREYNNFALADALAVRDRKTAWVEYEKIRREGTAIEEVHGVIFWVFKTMFLIAVLTKEEALSTGIKDYPYRKYGAAAKKYTVSELAERLRELKDMYHEAHRGNGDFALLFERFILTA